MKKNIIDCKFIEECGEKRCSNAPEKNDCCEKCSFYHMIDSGYGHCRVFPTTIIVAWCKNICGQYKKIRYTFQLQ